jgi:hydrogenase maturation protein HypF
LRQRVSILVTGIVQGVGFRPFVYRIASSLALVGYVQNLGDAGVRIVVDGTKKNIDTLVKKLETEHPSISRIDSLDLRWESSDESFKEFIIEKSSIARNADTTTIVPPDIATCKNCVSDLINPHSYWYQYPFTSCAACGPRFSTIQVLPYDRPNTTMIDFPLCDTCNTGYTDPLNRRYHAQTTACETCGPYYQLLDATSKIVSSGNSVKSLSAAIDKNAIVAIQGITGTHIVTKISDDQPIRLLRKRKERLERPFAIMVRNLDTIMEFAKVSNLEKSLLQSWRKPIVLVKKANLNSEIFPSESLEQVAPGLDTIGVMLPYAPLHHLLFQFSSEPALVMTSANPAGVPMYIQTDTIIANLRGIVDFFLVHNRRIHQRVDDSVVKALDESHSVFIRRARGYVPEPITFQNKWKPTQAIAVGPEEKATGAVLKNNRIYLTQHIGDTNCVESIEFLEEALDHMTNLLDVKNIRGVACDLHPEFLSTTFAENIISTREVPLLRIQHHYAHLVSLLVDNRLEHDTRITCITADGFGYGSDAKAWGGEILVGDMIQFERKGGLSSSFHAGGDLAAQFALRPFLGIMDNSLTSAEILRLVGKVRVSPDLIATEDVVSMLLDIQKRRIKTIETTSAGRFLDAAALALGVCSENSYDGECPMKLEAVAQKSDLRIEQEFLSSDSGMTLDIRHPLAKIIELRKNGKRISDLAYAIQWYLGTGLAEIACHIADNEDTRYVGFSGGVAVNHIITKAVVSRIKARGFRPLVHSHIPPGDGGISAGQVAALVSYLNN